MKTYCLQTSSQNVKAGVFAITSLKKIDFVEGIFKKESAFSDLHANYPFLLDRL